MENEEAFPVDGSCSCGALKYRLLARPMFVHCCHCTCCQRETGASFALNAMIESDNVERVEGEIETVNIPTNSGKGQDIVRCSVCQSVVWSHYAGLGNALTFLRVGTLSRPDSCPPNIHIYTSTRQGWVNLSGDIPVVEEYYQRSKYWPQPSIDRFKRVVGN